MGAPVCAPPQPGETIATTPEWEVIEADPGPTGRAVYTAVRSTVYPVLNVGHKVMHLPIPYGAVERLARMGPMPKKLTRIPVELPRARAELIRAPGVPETSTRAILYCHGGGFLFCGINTHIHLIARLSEYTGCPVLAVDYRMLPKYSVNEAVSDCMDGFEWLIDSGVSPGSIAISGDSAGGYLAMTVAQRMIGLGMTPGAVAMMSPLLQLVSDRPPGHGPMIPHSALTALTTMIARVDPDVYEPLDHIDPGFPPTMIHVSGAEELLHDARIAGERLHAAGDDVTVVVWPRQVHVFQVGAPFIHEGIRSLQQIAEFIEYHTAPHRAAS